MVFLKGLKKISYISAVNIEEKIILVGKDGCRKYKFTDIGEKVFFEKKHIEMNKTDLVKLEEYKYYNPGLKNTTEIMTRYRSHCHNCKYPIDGFIDKKCEMCGGYFCAKCAYCKCSLKF